MTTPELNPHYQNHYDDRSFWSKLTGAFKKAGRALIEKALTLYYTALDDDTPAWAKTKIYAALGYFIFPVDLIPDPVPLYGYADDMAVLTAAFSTVALHIKDEHKDNARRKFRQIFG